MARSFESDANDNNMVKRDQSTNSDANSTEIVPPYTNLGHIPVPVVSSCQGLLAALEEFRGDIPFSSEIISRSTVDFTDNQRVLVNDVLEAALIESQYGIDRQFYSALTIFGESLETRIKEEERFYNAQKKRYTKIYEVLRHSAFPYSANQTACLGRMLRALYEVTGHPRAEADKEFRFSLRELVRLLHCDDHMMDVTPHRFILTTTIHYYLQEMVTRMDRFAKEEEERPHPDFVHPHLDIDLATYVVLNLDVLVDNNKVLTMREHFHYGMVEIYTKLVELFKDSGLELSRIQNELMVGIETRIRSLRKEPFLSKHAGIVADCLEFMSEFENNHPDREYKLVGDKLVLAPEGVNNKVIKEISWDLVYLQHVANGHLESFATFGNGVENVVTEVMKRFLALYPNQ